MRFITDLTKEEIKYICEAIPYQETVAYFTKYPKEFTQIRPGFRVKSLSEDMITRTLYEFRTKDFIASYLNKHIERWVKEIDEEFVKRIETGLDHNAAYVEVLSRSFFAKNVKLFFKIKEEEKTEECLLILSSVIAHVAEYHEKTDEELEAIRKDIQKQREKQKTLEHQLSDEKKKMINLKKREENLNTQLEQHAHDLDESYKKQKKIEEECSQLNGEAKKIKAELAKEKDEKTRKVSELQQKVDVLAKKNEEQSMSLKESFATIADLEEKLAFADEESQTWKNKVRNLERNIFNFKAENARLLAERDNNKNQIKELNANLEKNLMEQRRLEITANEISMRCYGDNMHTPMHPENFDDFAEYFSYNLKNIGFTQNEEVAVDFLCYLQKILFQGVPLLIKRGPGINIANLLSNTLYGIPVAAHLLYSDGLGVQNVDEFLTNTTERVICIDGFMGNCNVLELIPILGQHRNKIIILTYMFDKTLTFIPQEILAYVHFIRADMFDSLLRIKDITEDPSKIKEVPYTYKSPMTSDTRLQKIFRDVACECGIEFSTASTMADTICDENSLDAMLIFTLLPYIQNILGKNPYNCSKRLQRYAGESGRCIKKEIMLRWFGK